MLLVRAIISGLDSHARRLERLLYRGSLAFQVHNQRIRLMDLVFQNSQLTQPGDLRCVPCKLYEAHVNPIIYHASYAPYYSMSPVKDEVRLVWRYPDCFSHIREAFKLGCA